MTNLTNQIKEALTVELIRTYAYFGIGEDLMQVFMEDKLPRPMETIIINGEKITGWCIPTAIHDEECDQTIRNDTQCRYTKYQVLMIVANGDGVRYVLEKYDCYTQIGTIDSVYSDSVYEITTLEAFPRTPMPTLV